VHFTNTKAAWYSFNNLLDSTDIARNTRRNGPITGTGERAAMLVINPGPRSIGGANIKTESHRSLVQTATVQATPGTAASRGRAGFPKGWQCCECRFFLLQLQLIST
jgi:hypothetical protein